MHGWYLKQDVRVDRKEMSLESMPIFQGQENKEKPANERGQRR